MAAFCVIRLPALGDLETGQVSWAIDGQESEMTCGTLDECRMTLQSLGKRPRIMVLLSTLDVLSTRVTTPKAKKSQLQTLVPYAVEEQLAEPLESQQVAHGSSISLGETQLQHHVSVVRQETLKTCLQRLQEHGIDPDKVFSEADFIIPKEEDQWSLLIEPDRPVILHGNRFVLALSPGDLIPVLKVMFANPDITLPKRCVVHDLTEESQALDQDLLDLLESHEITVDWQTHSQTPVVFLAQQGDPERAINLRQGEFSRQQALNRLWQPWRLSAALAGLLLLMIPAELWLQTVDQKHRLQDIRQQSVEIFKATFPDAKRIINPQQQMQNRLNSLKKAGLTGEKPFLSLFSIVSPVFGQMSDLTLESLRYRDQTLGCKLEIGSFEKLDLLKKSLMDRGIEVEIQSATTEQGRVRAQLQLQQKS
ncbi:MAG: hypothetical protein D6698_02290 [Gammaproteobacteria bacterium]|nr:MAG: hypothetical protein D6698_02290 [Gammaproteobacteria bacterium]